MKTCLEALMISMKKCWSEYPTSIGMSSVGVWPLIHPLDFLSQLKMLQKIDCYIHQNSSSCGDRHWGPMAK